MKIVCVSTVVLAVLFVCLSSFLTGRSRVASREIDLPTRSSNPERLVSREVSRDKSHHKEAEVPPSTKREDGYFQRKILELESSEEAGSRKAAEETAVVLYEWALTSPDEALSYVRGVIGKNVYAYELFVPAVLTAWSTVNPRGSMEYVVNNPDAIPFSLAMVQETLNAAVKHDGNMILEYSARIPGAWIEHVSRNLKEYFSKRGEDFLLLNHVSNLPLGSEQKMASLVGLADAYAAGGDWDSSWKIVSELVQMADDQEKASFVAGVFSTTASWTDPLGFIKWVNGNVSEEQVKDQFINTAASDWASRDIASYSGWLKNLPIEERKDSFIINIVDPIMSDDPISALEWAALIKNPESKHAYYSKILDRVDHGAYSKELARLVDQGVLPANLIKE